MELASINGQIVPLSEAKVSVLDRGFLFGDGVYEVLRVYQGKPFLVDAHFARLERSLKGLKLTASTEGLKPAIIQLLAKSGLQEATLYIQITRGARSLRQHTFSSESPVPPCTQIIFATPYNDEKNQALRVKGAKAVTFPDIRWGRVDLKTTNLLANVFAAEAAKEAGVYEAIFVNDKGFVTEGSHTNVFALIGGKLRTYPLSASVLPGVTRGTVLKICESHSIPLDEKPLTKDELMHANEVFVSATTAEIMPIVEIDGVKIGGGSPGKTTQNLHASYREVIRKFLS